VQVGNALIKSKKHPEFTDRYHHIKARRGHKKAIIVICRMILTAIWHILTDLKPYTPEGFLKSRPMNEVKILTTSQVLNLLRLRGYTIKDDVAPIIRLGVVLIFNFFSHRKMVCLLCNSLFSIHYFFVSHLHLLF
jgi:hypothetical protein